MRASVSVISITLAGSAQAKPGAVMIPPAEVDIGFSVPLGDNEVGASTEVRAGVHWASLYWKPTAVDVGFGYAGTFRHVDAAYATRTLGDADETALKLHGMYLHAGYAIEMLPSWRTWLGARIEGFTGHYGTKQIVAAGMAVRIATELYISGQRGGDDAKSFAFFSGTWAIGIYVEGVRRALPAEFGPVGIAAGATIRIPFIAAVAY